MSEVTTRDKINQLVDLAEVFMPEQLFPRPMLKIFCSEWFSAEVDLDCYGSFYFKLGKSVLFICDKDENVFLPNAPWKYKLDDLVFFGFERKDELRGKILYHKLVGLHYGKTLGEIFGSKPFVRNVKLYKSYKVEDLVFHYEHDSLFFCSKDTESQSNEVEDGILYLCDKGFKIFNHLGCHTFPFEKILGKT